ncbi:phosphoribosylamine--glycine ligase [Micrococcales bacterium 31B]|nr:phosphoribosylamine--glycine ligase [Micrococcales bacterium 31B]
MKILVIGTGAREHALVRSLAQDPAVTALHAAPGNPGIGQLATLHPLDILDGRAAAALAREVAADLVVIGPEAPLVAGVGDAVREAGIDVFGPSGAAAMLEGSKSFAKEVMEAAGVPTARAFTCTTREHIESALDEFGAPYVVKADGLAAGKGVVVTADRAEALAHGEACVSVPGSAVVIEEYLDGPEVSLFCICDGTTVVPLEPAQDFKRALDGDQGPNTGGMGAYSPLPWADPNLTAQVIASVAEPTIAEMAKRGTPFVGVLYCGLALTSQGMRVVEFNARFGDPETQVVLARLETPLAGVLQAAARGTLAALPPLTWSSDAAVTVVLASAGYPATSRSGDPITGIEDAEVDGAAVLHAGTALVDGTLVSNGGRVLSIVGTGTDLRDARVAAYRALDVIEMTGGQSRSDIAAKASRGATATSAIPVVPNPSVKDA